MPATQWPYQTVETRDFLRRLSPYLPEQIDVFQPTTGRYGQLRGLPFTQVGEKPVADVFWYLTDKAYTTATVSDDVAGNLLPVLYAFEDLATEMMLPDGRHVVPAVEVANMQAQRQGLKTVVVRAELEADYFYNSEINCFDAEGKMVGCPDESQFLNGNLKGWLEQALRQMHFAVGLQPHQYHRRIVGFDYTTGLKPAKLSQ